MFGIVNRSRSNTSDTIRLRDSMIRLWFTVFLTKNAFIKSIWLIKKSNFFFFLFIILLLYQIASTLGLILHSTSLDTAHHAIRHIIWSHISFFHLFLFTFTPKDSFCVAINFLANYISKLLFCYFVKQTELLIICNSWTDLFCASIK